MIDYMNNYFNVSNINIRNTEITYITKGNIYVNEKKMKYICQKYKLNVNTIEYPVKNKFYIWAFI